MMSSNIRLLAILCLIGTPLFVLTVPEFDSAIALERRIQGTWVLHTTEHAGTVTSQIPDDLTFVGVRHHLLPEDRELPADATKNVIATTFYGSEYVTRQYGQVICFGEFRIDARTHPPVLETRGTTLEWNVHYASASVYSRDRGTIRSTLELSSDGLRITAPCVRTDMHTPDNEEVTAVFQRWEGFWLSVQPTVPPLGPVTTRKS